MYNSDFNPPYKGVMTPLVKIIEFFGCEKICHYIRHDTFNFETTCGIGLVTTVVRSISLTLILSRKKRAFEKHQYMLSE